MAGFFEYNGKKVYDNQINRAVYLGQSLKTNNFLNRLLVRIGSLFKGTSALLSGEANNHLESALNSMTGAHLTGAQNEANAFSAAEAEKSRQFEEQMSNTAYQRQVADLQAAGINPIMAASNGVSLPSSAAAASVSPSAATFQLGQIMDLIRMKEMLPLEKSALKAQIANTSAQTNKTEVETESGKISLKYQERNEQLEQEGRALANDLSRDQRIKLNVDIAKGREEIKKVIAETKSEEEKVSLMVTQELLNNANARKITELLPFEKAYEAAKTEEAKQQAGLAMVQAAYQNGLISYGMIEAVVRQAEAQAKSAEYQASIDHVRAQMSGDEPITDISPATEAFIKGIGRLKNFVYR